MQPVHIASVDANLLVALDALLIEHSVTRAAQRVGVSQSAMSHKLRRLRDLFDDELLVAGGGTMLPTARAAALAPQLRDAIEALEHSLRPPDAFDPHRSTRTHTVVSTDYAELIAMPSVLAAAATVAPKITVELLPFDRTTAARLTDGTADVCIGAPFEAPGLRRRLLYDERLLCAVRVDHPRAPTSLTLQEWLEYEHVVYARPDRPPVIDLLLAAKGLARRTTVRTPHVVGGPLIAARTDLLYTGLSAPIRELAKLAPLRLLPPPPEIANTNIAVAMTWHERFDRDPAARWLRDFTAEATLRAVAAYGLGPSSATPEAKPR